MEQIQAPWVGKSQEDYYDLDEEENEEEEYVPEYYPECAADYDY